MANQDQSKSREDVIDTNLRRVYEEAMGEGIPDRFTALLAQLKQQDVEESKKK